jgi:hypothetical protein
LFRAVRNSDLTFPKKVISIFTALRNANLTFYKRVIYISECRGTLRSHIPEENNPIFTAVIISGLAFQKKGISIFTALRTQILHSTRLTYISEFRGTLRSHIPEESNLNSYGSEKLRSHIREDSDIYSSAAKERPV